MNSKHFIFLFLFFLIMIFFGCKKNKTTIYVDALEKDQVKLENNILENYKKYLPTDTIIRLKYSIFSERLGYQIDNFDKHRKKYLAEYEGYDKNGKLIEYILFTSDGQIIQQDISVYQNGLLKDLYRFSNKFHNELYKFSNYYDQNKRFLFSTMSTYKKRLKKEVLKTNTDCFTEDDFEDFKTWDELTITGNKIEEKTFDKNIFINTKKIKYDEQGEIIESKDSTKRFYYDHLNRCIKEEYIFEIGDTLKTFYQYKSYNKPIEKKITIKKWDTKK